MILAKPSVFCNGCELYGEKCHCLCHKDDLIDGKHEIIYNNGEGSAPYDRPGERT